MIISALLVILALGGGFFAGMQFQKNRVAMVARNGFYQSFGQNGQMRGRFGQNGSAFRPVRGQVLSIDPTGLTVKLVDGSSKIVVVSSSTMFAKSTNASESDVKTGDNVMVVGTQNSDGSITASNVEINPGQMPTPTSAAQQ
ncbi:MAG TPA: DUF5666 domain-containing protein [Patescibacteria group bacterium]|nr:DUF5666 domain-containing protein [Patescibacteria group bacterium]